ncbi:MAG: 50S ribosomal protein L29 [SAR86 cluster bacterium]|jgi:ribosomal protein L29|nr:50S ribosomal protein L29 [SAR86 cluster bacterium]
MAKEGLLSRLRKGEVDNVSENSKLEKELVDLKFNLKTGQLKETHKIKLVRRQIARLKTLTNESKDSK